MAIAGAGFGAAQGLEQILAEQMVRAQLAQRQKEAEQQAAIQQQRLAQDAIEGNARINQGQQQIDLAAGDRRERSNVKGVRRMLGESITQRQGPITPEDRRGMAALQIEAGDDPTLLNEPKVERDPIADFEEQEKIRAKYRPKPTGTPRDRKQIWVRRGGQVVPIEEGSAQAGDEPYDPVAARSSQPTNPAEAQDTAREAKRISTDLLNHKGLDGAFGVINTRLPTFRQDTADAEVLRDALTSLLTLENTGKLKGVLSNADMAILRQASTTIAGPMSPGAARTELKRIAEVMGRATGEGGLPKMDMATSRGGGTDPAAAAQALIDKARAARGKPGG